MNHEAASLPELVQNLVKNWEVEASFKPELKDWRTIDHENYSFAINSEKPQGAENMLKVWQLHPTCLTSLIVSQGRNLQRHHLTQRILRPHTLGLRLLTQDL